MGIQLDWQIEAEHTEQRDQEDPLSKRTRRRARRQLILLALGVAAGVCGVLGGILWRLQQIENHQEADLRAVVEAEFTAIRIGNSNAFMDIQRSASTPWLQSQNNTFNDYQTLKQSGRLGAEMTITDVVVDEERGRVTIREVIDGVAYDQVWFYWRYNPQDTEDDQAGWRHVPADVTFWGAERTIEKEGVTIRYHELDEGIAEGLASAVSQWWQQGCDLMDCDTPDMELIIDPEADTRLAWEPPEGWRLRLLSPYLNARVPVSDTVPAGLRHEIAVAIAQRQLLHASGNKLVFTPQEVIEFDTSWVKYQLLDWLVAGYEDRASPFMDSISTAFGDQTPGRIARSMIPGQSINTLAGLFDPNATGLPDFGIERLQMIDWREFFTWRLLLERQRLRTGDLFSFYALYENGQGNQTAQVRAVDPNYPGSPVETVQKASFTFRGDGTLAVLVEVIDANNITTQIQFVWNGQTFVRAN